MSKTNKPSKPNEQKHYRIVRKEEGYIVVDQNDNQITQQDVWPLTISKLERILRKDIGI